MGIDRKTGRILIIDDNEANLSVTDDHLQEHGFQTVMARNGEMGIKRAKFSHPDLILLDIMMSGMDGFETCRRLKQDEQTREIPVIFMTALSEVKNKVQGFDVGGVDYITKPIEQKELLARLKTHLSLHFARQSLRQHNRDLALLNRMSHALQKCPTEQDTYAVITDSCLQLFPSSSGHLLIYNDADDTLETMAHWGNSPSDLQQFNKNDLDYLYPEKGHVVDTSGSGEIFSHVRYSREDQRICGICVPVSLPETQLGLLLFSFEPGRIKGLKDDWRHEVESRQNLITGIVEHYALALINLRLRKILRLESIHDPLTELYNRRHMEASLEREISRAQRHKTSVGILMLDIDHFKVFNDTYGHKAGDAILKGIAALLKSSSRGEDIACRYGGEEFLLILPNTKQEYAIKRAEQLLEQVRRHNIVYQERMLSVTISIGVAIYPLHCLDIQGLICAADAAMYQAKEGGRNQVAVAII